MVKRKKYFINCLSLDFTNFTVTRINDRCKKMNNDNHYHHHQVMALVQSSCSYVAQPESLVERKTGKNNTDWKGIIMGRGEETWKGEMKDTLKVETFANQLFREMFAFCEHKLSRKGYTRKFLGHKLSRAGHFRKFHGHKLSRAVKNL